MKLEEAFLQEIVAHPDDDTPRLVYADWLQEQPDPVVSARGAFIRAQVAVARLPDAERDRSEWGERSRSLLAEHEWDWTRPLLLKCKVDRWGFSRGMVEEISLRASSFLEHAPALLRLAPVRSVHLTDVKSPADLAHCPELAGLRTLSLAYNKLGDRGVRALAESPHLANLEELDLTQTDVGPRGVEALLTSPHLTRLAVLRLSRNRLTGCDWPALFASSRRTEMTGLFLSQTVIEVEDLLAAADHLPHLTALDLSHNGFYPQQETIPALASCERLAGLRTLDLQFANLNPLHVRMLTTSPHLRQLTALHLGYSPVGSQGAESLAGSPNLSDLTTLDLCRTEVSDAGAEALIASLHLKRLTRLDLRANPVSDAIIPRLLERFGPGVRV